MPAIYGNAVICVPVHHSRNEHFNVVAVHWQHYINLEAISPNTPLAPSLSFLFFFPISILSFLNFVFCSSLWGLQTLL